MNTFRSMRISPREISSWIPSQTPLQRTDLLEGLWIIARQCSTLGVEQFVLCVFSSTIPEVSFSSKRLLSLDSQVRKTYYDAWNARRNKSHTSEAGSLRRAFNAMPLFIASEISTVKTWMLDKIICNWNLGLQMTLRQLGGGRRFRLCVPQWQLRWGTELVAAFGRSDQPV